MKYLSWLLPCLIALGVVVGCDSENLEELEAESTNACDTLSTANISFSKHVDPILQNHCAISGCHIGPSPEAGRDYSQFDDVKAVEDIIVGQITGNGGPLMPQGGPKLPDCDIQKIRLWVQAGAPNN